MDVNDLLIRIQPLWMQRTRGRFSINEGDSDKLQSQFEELFDSLVHAIASGNSDELRRMLEEWLKLSSTSVVMLGERSLVETMIILQSITFKVAEEELEDEEFVHLIKSSLPIFSDAIDCAAKMDLKRHVEIATKELDRAHQSIDRIEKNKSEFISIAAHELKTPLTLIEGYTAMLQDQLDEHNILDQAAILMRGIDKGTTRLREIVNDMIDISMIDNEMLALNFQPIWINRLFPQIEQDFRSKVTTRNQTLTLSPFPHQQMTFADEERLLQAISYIVSNAIKFTPDGGKITVKGDLLPGFAEITITDTGIGINPSDHQKIFEKFRNLGKASLHSSGKLKYKGGGPGLGLPITKGIIEAHGGAIWVESDGYDEEKCPGTTFHVLIPLREQPPDEQINKLIQSLTYSEYNRTQETVMKTEVIDKSG
ncbi:MAG: HAMP domain-containing sensor histidine kinase [Anaerolineales bacterium]|jgi:signal transduction histidine kinase